MRVNGRPLEGFPFAVDTQFIASPAAGDVTDSGSREICIGAADGRVWLLDLSGSVLNGWPVQLPSAVGTSPVFGDIDADSSKDVVVAARRGEIWAFNSSGEVLGGWPRQTRGMILSSPAVADLDGIAGDEVLVATFAGWAHCWNGHAESLPEWPRFTRTMARTTPLVLDQAGSDFKTIVLASPTGIDHRSVLPESESPKPEAGEKAEEEIAKTPELVPAVFSIRLNRNPIFLSHGDNAAVHLSIPEAAGSKGVRTSVIAYDVSGRRVSEVFTGVLGPGVHVLPWRTGTSLSTGIYFIRARAGVKTVTTKALIFR